MVGWNELFVRSEAGYVLVLCRCRPLGENAGLVVVCPASVTRTYFFHDDILYYNYGGIINHTFHITTELPF